jgi:hypothetical protein
LSLHVENGGNNGRLGDDKVHNLNHFIHFIVTLVSYLQHSCSNVCKGDLTLFVF